MTRPQPENVFATVGFVAFNAGLAWVYPPAALMVSGMLLMALAALLVRGKR